MRDAGHCYEYVFVYVDDIMAMMIDPEKFFKELEDIYGYKLKGVGPPSYHLGGDFIVIQMALWYGERRLISRECLIIISRCLVMHQGHILHLWKRGFTRAR